MRHLDLLDAIALGYAKHLREQAAELHDASLHESDEEIAARKREAVNGIRLIVEDLVSSSKISSPSHGPVLP